MADQLEHIAVCVCTFRRPDMLAVLLRDIERQPTGERFTFSIVVVDNDRARSAEAVCQSFSRSSSTALRYDVEPEQNIALARNRAVRNATGDFVALIDDDETPSEEWLLNLHTACHALDADGVLAPVLPSYEGTPPAWVVRGGFYERPSHPTGTLLTWEQTRSGNALLRTRIFGGVADPFRPEFGMGGEDRDFFRRMIERGGRFKWCDEAPVHEIVPAVRCTRSFMLRRALLRGTIPHFTWIDLIKSMVAVPLYGVMLPLALIQGHHRFMSYLIAQFDHIGRILAFCGVNVIKQKYVVE